MRSYNIYKNWLIYCSFAIAILLQFISLVLIKWYFRPSWVMMLLVYWIVIFPYKVNIGAGFTLGLIMDGIFDSIFGIHALSFSIISYLVTRRIYFIRHASILQQSSFVLFLSLIDQIIRLLIKFLIIGILYVPEMFWISILNGVMWPFLIFVMRSIMYRF